MKKLIIAAVLVVTTVITALSFNKKDDAAKSEIIKIEKAKFAEKNADAPKNDISSID